MRSVTVGPRVGWFVLGLSEGASNVGELLGVWNGEVDGKAGVGDNVGVLEGSSWLGGSDGIIDGPLVVGDKDGVYEGAQNFTIRGRKKIMSGIFSKIDSSGGGGGSLISE